MSTGKTGKALLELALSFPDRLLVTFGFAYRIDQTHFSYLSFYITWRDISQEIWYFDRISVNRTLRSDSLFL
jgi:hypothetical protein